MCTVVCLCARGQCTCQMPANRWCLIYGGYPPPLRPQQELRIQSGAHTIINCQWGSSLKRAHRKTSTTQAFKHEKWKHTCDNVLAILGLYIFILYALAARKRVISRKFIPHQVDNDS